MLYAKIVLGLAVEGPFDYIVPSRLIKKIKVGARVVVNFRNREIVGYVVGLSSKTDIEKTKIITRLIDDLPVLDKNILSLTKDLSDYYCCCWGQAIETALPVALRRGKGIVNIGQTQEGRRQERPQVSLLYDLDGRSKWDIYLSQIKDAIDNDSSAIVLVPDIDTLFKAREKISVVLKCPVGILYRKQKSELEQWLSIKRGIVNVVVATRSGVFAPFNNLGIIIIDEEQDSVYKQDQVPHYNAREVAFMRIHIERARLILGTTSPSLESFYLMKKKKIKYMFIPRSRPYPEIKIIKQRHIFSKYMEDSIASTLNSKGKVLLFLNRRGFATYLSCSNCQTVIKCPRCSINLVYHFKDNILNCHYCNFKMPAQKICPNCNAGYIRYLGTGIEKIESEASRLFPQAKIKLWGKKDANLETADIFISTELIIREAEYSFDLLGILSIDNYLNRTDFRSSEKTFALLSGLLRLTQGKFIVQTALERHHSFAAIESKNPNLFYEEELKQRRQLSFPPYSHIGLVKLRGQKEDRVKQISESLFGTLSKTNKNIKALCANPAQPLKLRGKYCWQILMKFNSCHKGSSFIKKHLKDVSHSGTIITVDIDHL